MFAFPKNTFRSLSFQPIREVLGYVVDLPTAPAAAAPPADIALTTAADEDFDSPRPAGLSDLPVELLQRVAGLLPVDAFQALRRTSRHHYTCLSDPVVMQSLRRRTEGEARHYQQRLRAEQGPPLARLQLCIEVLNFLTPAGALLGSSQQSREQPFDDLWIDTMGAIRGLGAASLRAPDGQPNPAFALIEALEAARNEPHLKPSHRTEQAGAFSRTVARLILQNTPPADRLEMLLGWMPVYTAASGMGAYGNLSMLLEMSDDLPAHERAKVHAALAGPISRLDLPWKSIIESDRAESLVSTRL
jgi:hypothetical protein